MYHFHGIIDQLKIQLQTMFESITSLYLHFYWYDTFEKGNIMIKFHHSVEKSLFSFFHIKSLCYKSALFAILVKRHFPLLKTLSIVTLPSLSDLDTQGAFHTVVTYQELLHKIFNWWCFVSKLSAFPSVCGIYDSTYFAHCGT